MDSWRADEGEGEGAMGFGADPPPFSSAAAPLPSAEDDIFGGGGGFGGGGLGGGGGGLSLDVPPPPAGDDEADGGLSNVDLAIPPPPADDADAAPPYAAALSYETTSVELREGGDDAPSPLPSTSIKAAPPPSHHHLQDSAEIELCEAFNVAIKKTNVNGDGVSSFVTYSVVGTTTLEFYSKKEFAVERRFSDFVWLHAQLQRHHRGIIVPPLPEKEGLSGALSAGRFSESLISYRRRELERFLHRVTAHPTLATSKYLQLFLETPQSSDLIAHKSEEVRPASPAPSSGGIMGFFGRSMQTVGLATGMQPAKEIDEWFERKTVYMVDIRAQLEAVARHASSIASKFSERAAVCKGFQDACTRMSSCEEGKCAPLATAFEGLAYVSAQSPDLFLEASNATQVEFYQPVKSYTRLVAAVQKVLEFRLEKLAEYQAATRALEVKKVKGEDEQEAQQKVTETKEMFENVSEIVRGEIERFEANKADEIRHAIADFVQANINLEIRLLDMWKHLLNRIQDAS